MEFGKKQTSILYIDANQAFFCESKNAGVLQLDFMASGAIRDLEVVNQEFLDSFIHEFIEVNKISSSEILIILSGIFTFEKEFESDADSQQEADMQAFLSIVPFEESYSRTYQFNKVSRVIAVSKGFCDSLKSSFEKQKFSIVGIVPFTVIQVAIPELANNLDLKLFLDKLDTLKQYSVSITAKEVAKNTPQKSQPVIKNKRTIILLGTFGFLLLILLVLIVKSLMPAQPKKTGIQLNNPSPSPVRYVEPSPTVFPEKVLETTPAGILLTPVQKNVQGISTQSAINNSQQYY